ncbi:hypothetical protein [Bradyrhizobium sp. 141]|uniref:hypothetical protein n=1 Tax=Bradyrhizobium sp. 141 TaxID=2782617 RepID=UPI001FFAB114|nr:hypothetical protein [Bradyrhizobium sp. 141]MCK1722056.1 hypothetical protein [Bradyrhizobium sp. 141]
MRSSLRTALLIFGFAGISWSATAFPILQSAAHAREVAARIMAEERFKNGVAARLLERMQRERARTVLAPEITRARGLVGLLAAQEATRQMSPAEADRSMHDAETDLELSLTISPVDAFLWLMLYSVSAARNGIDEKCVSYLEQSYSTGPREGWIALRRNRLALAALQMLSEPMQESATSEFVGMVDSYFIAEAAANLRSTGWPHRERLLAKLGQIDVTSREMFAKWLARDGVKVAVPGVKLDERPW